MKRLLIIALLAFFSQAQAHEPAFYFGADGQFCKMCFKRNFGDTIFKKDMPGMNPFLGVNLNEVVMIEAGYQYLSASRANTLTELEYSAGTPVHPIVSPVTFKSTLTLKGPHVDFLLLTPSYSQLPLQFFSGVGISQTNAVFQRKTLQLNCAVGEISRKMAVSRSLRRVVLGAHYFFNADFAIRATLIFMNTQKLHAFASDGVRSDFVPEVRPEKNVCYGLGLRWGF